MKITKSNIKLTPIFSIWAKKYNKETARWSVRLQYYHKMQYHQSQIAAMRRKEIIVIKEATNQGAAEFVNLTVWDF